MKELFNFDQEDLSCQSRDSTSDIYNVASLTLMSKLHPYLLTESLNELEDHDLDALMADLGSISTFKNSSDTDNQLSASAMTQKSEPAAALPPPPNTAESSGELQMVT